MKTGTFNVTKTLTATKSPPPPTEISFRRAFRARECLRILGLFAILWIGILSHVARAQVTSSFCRAADGEGSPWLNSGLPEDFAEDVDTIRTLVQKLRHELDIPLSFIENRINEPIVLPKGELSLEELLRAVVDQHEHYQCKTFSGRLVLRSSDLTFDLVISGVDISGEPRMQAVYTYIKHVRNFDQRFKDWEVPLIATAGESPPILTDLVTLSPRAPMIQHLFQLLGQDEALYFDVPAPDPSAIPWRTIDVGEVRRPWQRRPVKVRPPADKTGAIQ